MYFLNFDHQIITSLEEVDVASLKCHEHVVKERLNSLKLYLFSLEGDILISSIIVCNKTNTIIDGHHRYHALKEMGFELIPVTYINYEAIDIKAYFDDRISKSEILSASESGNFLPPKSSKHVVLDKNKNQYKPIILLSSMYHLTATK